jgi:hypothetical protein
MATADMHLKNIVAVFMQYTMPPFNGFRVVEQKTKASLQIMFSASSAIPKMILNTEEMASIWHLPTRFTETPNIKWLLPKKPRRRQRPASGLLLGRSHYRGDTTKIHIDRDDRRATSI